MRDREAVLRAVRLTENDPIMLPRMHVIGVATKRGNAR